MLKLNINFHAVVDSHEFVAKHCKPDKETHKAFKLLEDGQANVRDFAKHLRLPYRVEVLDSFFSLPIRLFSVGRNIHFVEVGHSKPVAVTKKSAKTFRQVGVYWQVLGDETLWLEDELLNEVETVLSTDATTLVVNVLLATGEVLSLKPIIKIRD